MSLSRTKLERLAAGSPSPRLSPPWRAATRRGGIADRPVAKAGQWIIALGSWGRLLDRTIADRDHEAEIAALPVTPAFRGSGSWGGRIPDGVKLATRFYQAFGTEQRIGRIRRMGPNCRISVVLWSVVMWSVVLFLCFVSFFSFC